MLSNLVSVINLCNLVSIGMNKQCKNTFYNNNSNCLKSSYF